MGFMRFTIVEEAEGVAELLGSRGAATAAAAVSGKEKVATADVVLTAAIEGAKDNVVVVMEVGEVAEGKNRSDRGEWVLSFRGYDLQDSHDQVIEMSSAF